MRWIKKSAARGAVLSLLCLIGAAAPRVADQASPVVSLAAAPGQLIVELATPTPTVSPTGAPPVQLPPGQLAQELTTRKAPVPPGPSTDVPILLYHYIRVNPVPTDRVGFNLSTPPAMFQAQMQYLADHGFHVLSLHQAVVAIAGHRPLPARPVVLTFDDGYADFFTDAIPALRAHGFTATDFVISGRMGVYSFMTASQVQAADQMGFTIGAHTVDHYALAALSPARALWEMHQSKVALESLLGHPVIDFAYPYGSFTSFVSSQAKSLGFETAASTLAGTVHSSAQLMFLSRVRIGGAMTLATFAQLVGGPTPAPTRRPSPSSSPTPSPSPVPTPTPQATPIVSPSPSRLS